MNKSEYLDNISQIPQQIILYLPKQQTLFWLYLAYNPCDVRSNKEETVVKSALRCPEGEML